MLKTTDMMINGRMLAIDWKWSGEDDHTTGERVGAEIVAVRNMEGQPVEISAEEDEKIIEAIHASYNPYDSEDWGDL